MRNGEYQVYRILCVVTLATGLLTGCGGTTSGQTGGPSAGASAQGGSGQGGVGQGGSNQGGMTQGGAATVGGSSSCLQSTDCVWGEIGHEILQRSDCMCLYGCPSIIMNSATRERRQAQYTALCDPNHDAAGNPCPIDDCIMPPQLVCSSGVCISTN